ncbi:MAG: type II toxin-antitoxin system HicB family antitoxin [Chloroflexi bacterium]|nr:type II toxin-antitoxin system HicB family antitoxin [Chloroflexota bacterium]
MVAKINVSLPEDVLQEMDRAAKEAHSSRSAFLVQAVKHFLEEREEAKRRQRRQEAAEKIVRLADEIGPWDAAAEVLKWRQQH